MNYRLYRTFTHRDQTDSFYEVLPHTLYVTPQDWYARSQPVGVHSTLFAGVTMTGYKEKIFPRKARMLPQKPTKTNRVIDLYNILKAIIFRRWQPDRFHVVAHSSGIDSRLLSFMIRELAEKHGEDWLGRILFVEHGGEAEGFQKIMRAEGWREDQYLTFDAFDLSFDMMTRKFNGTCGFPVNMFFDPYYKLAAEGFIPDDAQFFGGYGQYIERALKWQTVHQFFYDDYYYQMHAFNLFGHWTFPYFDIDYFQELTRHTEAYDRRQPRMCEQMVRLLPKELQRIHRMTTDDVIRSGYRRLPDYYMKQLQADYDKSWYGRKIRQNLSPNVEYSLAWGRYSEAAICEINNRIRWQK